VQLVKLVSLDLKVPVEQAEHQEFLELLEAPGSLGSQDLLVTQEPRVQLDLRAA